MFEGALFLEFLLALCLGWIRGSSRIRVTRVQDFYNGPFRVVESLSKREKHCIPRGAVNTAPPARECTQRRSASIVYLNPGFAIARGAGCASAGRKLWRWRRANCYPTVFSRRRNWGSSEGSPPSD